MIRVLLVDDQAIVRSGLRLALADTEGVTVVGEASNGREAVEQARRADPDVVLMDIRMPQVDGISAIDGVLAAAPHARVLMLSTFGEEHEVMGSLRAGASGYLLKDAEPREITAAVLAVAAGESVVSPRVTRGLIDAALSNAPVERSAGPLLEGLLTPRELDVLRLIASGRSNLQIASELYLSEPTVKTHVSSLLNKLGLRSRVQAVIAAYETGLVRPGEARGTASGRAD